MTAVFPVNDGLLLQQIPPFAALEAIAEKFDVDFTLFGGSASRAIMRIYYRPAESFDIFDLTPFTSDIDLLHSGKKEQTGEIRAAIFDQVPFATWCRWAIVDAETFREADANMKMGLRVPLREIRISTKVPLELDPQVLTDLEDCSVSWSRNADFAESSYARDGKTLEIFGLMMAMNVVADMEDIAGGGALRDEQAALDWLESPSAVDEVFGQLRKLDEAEISDVGRSPLQCRAWHLSSVRLSRGNRNRLDQRLDNLLYGTIEEMPVIHGQRAISVSKRSLAGDMRIPRTDVDVMAGRFAKGFVDKRLSEIAASLGLDTQPEIDPCFEIIAVFPGLPILQTASDLIDEERDSGDFASAPSGEFLQLAWSADDAVTVEGITAFYLPGGDHPAIINHVMSRPPAFAVGGVFGPERCWVRIDVEGLAYRQEGVPGDITIDVVAVAPRRPDSTRLEGTWLSDKPMGNTRQTSENFGSGEYARASFA